MLIRWGTVVLVMLMLAAWIAAGRPASASEAAAPEAEASQSLRNAQRTQQMTRGTLRVLSSGTRCAESRFVSYRRSDREPEVVDQWYVVSQLWADAMLLASDRDLLRTRTEVQVQPRQPQAPAWDERDARCHVDKGFVFLDRLWDDEEGGYYPRSNPNGSKITRNEQYADDNAL